MSDKFRFPTAEEITRDWGERCPDFDQDCGCCQMWATYDMVKGIQAENERLRKALENMVKWHGRRDRNDELLPEFMQNAEVATAMAALEPKP